MARTIGPVAPDRSVASHITRKPVKRTTIGDSGVKARRSHTGQAGFPLRRRPAPAQKTRPAEIRSTPAHTVRPSTPRGRSIAPIRDVGRQVVPVDNRYDAGEIDLNPPDPQQPEKVMSGPTAGNFEDFAKEYAGTQALARGGRQSIDGPRIIRRPGESPLLTNLTGERLDATIQQPQMISGQEGSYEALSGDFGDFGGAVPRGGGTGQRPVSGGQREGSVISIGDSGGKRSGLGGVYVAAAQGRARKTSALLRQADRRTDIEERKVNLLEGKNDTARANDEALNQERLARASVLRKQAEQMMSQEQKQTFERDMAKDKQLAKLYEDAANAEGADAQQAAGLAIDAFINNKLWMMLDQGQDEVDPFGPNWAWRGYKEQKDPTYGWGPAGSALKRQ